MMASWSTADFLTEGSTEVELKISYTFLIPSICSTKNQKPYLCSNFIESNITQISKHDCIHHFWKNILQHLRRNENQTFYQFLPLLPCIYYALDILWTDFSDFLFQTKRFFLLNYIRMLCKKDIHMKAMNSTWWI